MQGKDYFFWFKEKIGWILIVLFSIIPVVLLFATNDVGELFYDVPETLKTFGKITALVGFVLYAINLLLAVRKQWLENFFNGLNRVYIAHHITGGIALSFLLFHPLLLAAQYVNFSSLSSLRYAADYLLPDTFNSMDELAAIQEVVAFDSGIIALIGMVVLLVLTFFVKLPYRLWLFTHRFLGVAFLFAGAVGAGVAGFASGASVAASSLVPASSTTFPSASFTVTLPSASSEMIAPSISSPFLSIATISPVELPPKYLDEMSSNTDAGANIPATSITAVAAEVVISDPATSFFTIMTLRTLPYVFYYFLRPFCVIVSALISS